MWSVGFGVEKGPKFVQKMDMSFLEGYKLVLISTEKAEI